MGKNIVHLPEGQDFFGGPAGKHTAMMKDFGFKESIGSGKSPVAKAHGGRMCKADGGKVEKVPVPKPRPDIRGDYDQISKAYDEPGMGLISHTSYMHKRTGKETPDIPKKALPLAKGGMVHDDAAADKVMIKKGISQHETQEHGGKHADIKLRRGGKPKLPKSAKPLRRFMRRPPIQKPPILPTASSPGSALNSAAPPAPDFTATAGPPPNSGVTPMRRGGRC